MSSDSSLMVWRPLQPNTGMVYQIIHPLNHLANNYRKIKHLKIF